MSATPCARCGAHLARDGSCRHCRPPRNVAERNHRIAERVLDGETMDAIGLDYGITRERVRQIAKKFGVTGEDGRAARMVEWTCEVCGKSELRNLSRWNGAKPASAKTCGATECVSVVHRGPRSDGSIVLPDGRSAQRNPDGHWWTTPRDRRPNRVRAERHIAELLLGRRLRRNEWVVLIDGDPDNLDPANIGIVTPKQAMARRDGKPWSYTPIVRTEAA